MTTAQSAASETTCTVFLKSQKTRTNTLFTLGYINTLSSMQIQAFDVGMLSTNCYVVSCTETKKSIIIDPGFEYAQEADQITRYVDENALKVSSSNLVQPALPKARISSGEEACVTS
jgi:hypothetical protein